MGGHVFVSHAWGADRQTHESVRSIVHGLRSRGWSVWFDEDDMRGSIAQSMEHGIRTSAVFMPVLCANFVTKINRAHPWDNCYREVTYAMWMKKRIVPLVLDPWMGNVSQWPPGVAAMLFSDILYVDGSRANVCNAIHARLRREGLVPTQLWL